MTHRQCTISVFLLVGCAWAVAPAPAKPAEKPPPPAATRYAGLLGKAYNEPDFRRIKRALEPLEELVTHFDDGVGHGIDWSAVWEGYVVSPVTGPLTFHVMAHKPTTIDLFDRGRVTADGNSEKEARASLVVVAREGDILPIRISYAHARGGLGGWRVTWSYPGRPNSTIPTSALFFDGRIADLYHWTPEADPDSVDLSRFASVEARHAIVFYEPGRAAGWPANQGFFTWGNEMVQPFDKGYHLERGLNHAIDPTRRSVDRQARSRDGGETWVEEPFVVERPAAGEEAFPPREFDFSNPDFAVKTYHDRFWITTNRARSWHGPYRWPDLGLGPLTSRTDYVRLGSGSALLGFSIEDAAIKAQHNDRAFFLRFDGDTRELSFLGWLTPPDDLSRAVMPSTVQLGPAHFITAVRRKSQEMFDDRPPLSRNWIEAYESRDGAKSWRSLGEVASTDTGLQNGNPPSVVHVGDKMLAIAYGYRSIPYSIRARVSPDLGRTWSSEIILRRDVASWDMGYVRSALRSDGKIVSLYYLPTSERPELHLEATIWDPRTVREPGRQDP